MSVMTAERILLEWVDEGHNKFYEGWKVDGRCFVAWGPKNYGKQHRHQEVDINTLYGRIDEKTRKGYKVVEGWTQYRIPSTTLFHPDALRSAVRASGARDPRLYTWYEQEYIFDWDEDTPTADTWERTRLL